MRHDDLEEEIRSHIEEKTDELVAQGMSRADAERAARRAFGDVTRVKETARDVWRFGSVVETVARDVRYALRGLRRNPGFTIAVVLTLALGIGANGVMFALVNAVILRPLPYPHAERLISVSQVEDGRDTRQLWDFALAEWLRPTRAVETAAAYEDTRAVLTAPDGPTRIDGLRATHTYFPMFGVRPLLGRLFDATEALPGAPQVVLLSEQLWRDRFGADSAIVGRTASFDGAPRLVIGVLPAAFTRGREERYWIPLRAEPATSAPPNQGELFGYSVVARLREGASIDAVRTEVAGAMARLARDYSGVPRTAPIVMSLHERRHGESRRPLLLLFGAVGVLLLTACANIANLSLARAGRREREFAMRLALGASRWRIVTVVLIENLALAAGAAFLGLLLVVNSISWFVRISPGSIGSVEAIGVDGALLAYMSLVAVITALLFGLVPAVSASRATLSHTLASGTFHATAGKRQALARRALVIGQLAVALVFLIGAGLVAKTFWRVTFVDPGFRPERLLVADIDLRANRYSNATATAFFEDVMARVRREPGVQSIAYADAPPSRPDGVEVVMTRGRRPGDGSESDVKRFGIATVGPEYFQTIGAELVAGRFLGPDDRRGTQRVAVVAESFVQVNLAGAPAVGRTVLGDRDPATIVGVVKDVLPASSESRRYPLVYTALAQGKGNTHLHLIVRTTGRPEQLQPLIRETVHALDPAQPPPTFTTMERALAETVAPRRFTLVLLGVFAVLAFSLAVIGLYSVLAYLVSERTREMGIRMAVGADAGRVTRMILGHGLRLTITGLILGGAASIVAVRVLRASMYEMSVYDAPTFGAVAALLCVVALLASWLPARRASRVDPMLALRAD